jgi:hypothetical protein
VNIGQVGLIDNKTLRPPEKGTRPHFFLEYGKCKLHGFKAESAIGTINMRFVHEDDNTE